MSKVKPSKTLTIVFVIWAYMAAVIPVNFEITQLYQIQQSLSVSSFYIKKMVTLFWLMFACGQGTTAIMLNRFSPKTITRFALWGYMLSFTLMALANNPWSYGLARVGQGFFCGSMILMGRYSLSSRFKHDENLFLSQFVNIGIGLTIANSIAPMLGSYIGAFVHWRLIYIVVALFGALMFMNMERVFVFQAFKPADTLNIVKNTIFNESSVIVNAVICGLSRSMVVNFNVHMLFYLLHHHQWQSVDYGYLLFGLSMASILCRWYLKSLKVWLGYDRLVLLIIGMAWLLSFLAYEVFFNHLGLQIGLMGLSIYVGFSLLGTLYSSRAQFRIPHGANPMMFSLMGIAQMLGMSFGTYMAISLNSNSLGDLIYMSWAFFALLLVTNRVNVYDTSQQKNLLN